MNSHEQALAVYVDLADHFQRKDDPGMREIFLVLAADTALKAGQPAKAEQLRAELLTDNPYHLLKPFPTFAEAIQHPDIEIYVADLREKYPVEVARDLLEPLLPGALALSPQEQASRPVDTGPLTPPPTRRQPAAVPPAPRPPEDPSEPLRVFREAPDVAETQPPPTLPPQRAPRPAGQPRPAPAAPPRPRPPAPPPAGRPRPLAPPQPVAAAPPARTAPAASPPEEGKLTAGAWVGTLLFMVMLAAGVALLMLTLFPQELLDGVIQGP